MSIEEADIHRAIAAEIWDAICDMYAVQRPPDSTDYVSVRDVELVIDKIAEVLRGD